ncbi:MAG: hypothetical protein A4C66_10760 [Nitrospira sp. HN-bin3]|uniref:hypothetical protein n=1 Tax=Nitrospira cf. moscoviensis SBR1015 TaxID=96242 RepID=UPI000A0EA72B|nr:hypothetical protein [Nitrospira cf. moscoviensis SBR1015]OQW40307.1 MAG: hypothetical protein A4C66_10760 [Nitrospira sp. HN-bin3]
MRKLFPLLALCLVFALVVLAQDNSSGFGIQRTALVMRHFSSNSNLPFQYDEARGFRTTGLLVASPYEHYAELGASGFAISTVTNPAAGHDLLNAYAASPINSARHLHFSEVTISTSVAGEFRVEFTTSAGATCTSVLVQGTNLGSQPTDLTANRTCTTDPTVGAFPPLVFYLPANGSMTYRFDNAWVQAQNIGISVRSPAALTGNVTAMVSYYVTDSFY